MRPWLAPGGWDSTALRPLTSDLPHRSLGVTLWELFEFGAQPYRHLSDEEVLAFVVRQQHVKLARPRLKLPYADYW